MIIESLNSKLISNKLFLGSSVWSVCVKWLKEVNEKTPIGQYRLDHGLIIAELIETCKKGQESYPDLWSSPFPFIEIHSIFFGCQIFDIRFQLGQVQEIFNYKYTQNEDSDSTSTIILKTGQICVLFPTEQYKIKESVMHTGDVRKAVIKIPVQRFV